MRCHLCNVDIPTEANFCPTCGAQQILAATGPTRRLSQSQRSPYPPLMVNGICPKCGATEIYVDDKGLRDTGQGSYTALNLHSFWFAHTASIHTYLCAACGFIEIYLADKDNLSTIIEKWQRV